MLSTDLVLLADTVAVARDLAPSIATWFAVDAARLIQRGVEAAPGLVDRLTDGLEESAAKVGLPGGRAFAAIIVGTVRGEPGQIGGAVEGAGGSPHALTRAVALEVAGTAQWQVAADDRARATLAAAQAGYEVLGASPLAQRVAYTLDPQPSGRRRATRPARPRFGWEALTPAEHAVLDLVVEARRNGEIAEQLGLSKRTVESHISSILMKLEVDTRVELVVAAGRRSAGA